MEGAIGSICQQYYGPGTQLQQYWNGVGLGFSLAQGSALSSKLNGLNAARSLIPNSLDSPNQMTSFLANILFESVCLTGLEEAQCVKDASYCVSIYGDNYWGRGYIQLTGRANYQLFANAVNRQDIMANPSLVATDETLAWASAVWFWANNCGGAQNVGQGVKCVNSLECTSASSSIYFQFAPPYRLLFAQTLAGTLGASEGTAESIAVCPQMGTSLTTAWSQFCQYHSNNPSASVTCSGQQQSQPPPASPSPSPAPPSPSPSLAPVQSPPPPPPPPSTLPVEIEQPAAIQSLITSPPQDLAPAQSPSPSPAPIITSSSPAQAQSSQLASQTTNTESNTSSGVSAVVSATSNSVSISSTSVSTSSKTPGVSSLVTPATVSSNNSKGPTNSSSDSAASTNSELNASLSGGAIAGIVIAVLIALIAISAGVFVFRKKAKAVGKESELDSPSNFITSA
ncbi:UNVERIFIED_CONTAM: hypothetical protein HDU68_007139 [Siphonaria sp. JEL0065]|nr:hypothetical protein HDU68_007139 [Siphonaria sp. JEL0065]